MNSKMWAALTAAGVILGSVAHRAGMSGDPESRAMWRRLEKDAHALAQKAETSGGRWARELAVQVRQVKLDTRGLPGFMQEPALTAAQLSTYEKLLCDLANQERIKRGLRALKISPVLSEVARAHSREMAAKNYFAHESPTPSRRTALLRYQARFKRSPRLVAENIYKLQGPGFYRLRPNDFRRAHTGWMNSKGHRLNILRAAPAGGPTHIGVGIIVRDGSFWATQNFARPQ